MDATTYTGAGGTTTFVNADNGTVGFKPDLVWIKGRSNTGSHSLQDSVRGFGSATKLSTNSTNAENNNAADATDPIYGYVTAVTTTGFTAYAGTSPAQTNNSGVSYVAWQWQANQGTNVTNTSGSITSTVSANTTAGFSIVGYTGNGSVPATIGHGLGVAPQFIIIKDRSTTSNWVVQQASIGWTQGFLGMTTGAATTSTAFSNNTAPTSSVFTVGAYSNNNGENYVAYCWTPIAGFSATGTYTGNGSTDGPFLYLGFRPKFLMFKSVNYSAADTDWNIVDTSRSPYNSVSVYLNADQYNAEGTYTGFNILSNGVKLINTGGSFNGAGNTYMYLAFAENPFKYANAR